MITRIQIGLSLLLAFTLATSPVCAQPVAAPLLQSSNFTYLGAFALPTGQFGASYFTYGGNGVAPYKDPSSGKQTIFLEGHVWNPGDVAQVELPATLSKSTNWSSLPLATVLQPFKDITDGHSGTLNNSAGGNNFVYGMLVYNGKLIIGASNYYDASNSQNKSHGVSSLNLSATNDFQGFYSINATATPRALGGYMTTIPAEWQTTFGGPALTGNCCLSIIGNSSSGPAVTVFNPADLGVTNPAPGTTLLYYPLAHILGGGFYATTGTNIKGVAFPTGSRSVLFFGRHSESPYCYGPGTDNPALHGTPADGGVDTYCYDPCNASKGGHGYPYFHYVWAYDANDLLKVKNGQKQSWEILPYAGWKLPEMDSSGCAGVASASYDPAARRLYFAGDFGETPHIYVYDIAAPVTDTTPPANPKNLRIVP